MDMAGMGALAAAARVRPGGRVLLPGAAETLRRCWELPGCAGPQTPVETAP